MDSISCSLRRLAALLLLAGLVLVAAEWEIKHSEPDREGRFLNVPIYYGDWVPITNAKSSLEALASKLDTPSAAVSASSTKTEEIDRLDVDVADEQPEKPLIGPQLPSLSHGGWKVPAGYRLPPPPPPPPQAQQPPAAQAQQQQQQQQHQRRPQPPRRQQKAQKTSFVNQLASFFNVGPETQQQQQVPDSAFGESNTHGVYNHLNGPPRGKVPAPATFPSVGTVNKLRQPANPNAAHQPHHQHHAQAPQAPQQGHHPHGHHHGHHAPQAPSINLVRVPEQVQAGPPVLEAGGNPVVPNHDHHHHEQHDHHNHHHQSHHAPPADHLSGFVNVDFDPSTSGEHDHANANPRNFSVLISGADGVSDSTDLAQLFKDGKITDEKHKAFIAGSEQSTPDGFNKIVLPFMENADEKSELPSVFIAPVGFKVPPGYKGHPLPFDPVVTPDVTVVHSTDASPIIIKDDNVPFVTQDSTEQNRDTTTPLKSKLELAKTRPSLSDFYKARQEKERITTPKEEADELLQEAAKEGENKEQRKRVVLTKVVRRPFRLRGGSSTPDPDVFRSDEAVANPFLTEFPTTYVPIEPSSTAAPTPVAEDDLTATATEEALPESPVPPESQPELLDATTQRQQQELPPLVLSNVELEKAVTETTPEAVLPFAPTPSSHVKRLELLRSKAHTHTTTTTTTTTTESTSKSRFSKFPLNTDRGLYGQRIVARQRTNNPWQRQHQEEEDETRTNAPKATEYKRKFRPFFDQLYDKLTKNQDETEVPREEVAEDAEGILAQTSTSTPNPYTINAEIYEVHPSSGAKLAETTTEAHEPISPEAPVEDLLRVPEEEQQPAAPLGALEYQEYPLPAAPTTTSPPPDAEPVTEAVVPQPAPPQAPFDINVPYVYPEAPLNLDYGLNDLVDDSVQPQQALEPEQPNLELAESQRVEQTWNDAVPQSSDGRLTQYAKSISPGKEVNLPQADATPEEVVSTVNEHSQQHISKEGDFVPFLEGAQWQTVPYTDIQRGESTEEIVPVTEDQAVTDTTTSSIEDILEKEVEEEEAAITTQTPDLPVTEAVVRLEEETAVDAEAPLVVEEQVPFLLEELPSAVPTESHSVVLVEQFVTQPEEQANQEEQIVAQEVAADEDAGVTTTESLEQLFITPTIASVEEIIQPLVEESHKENVTEPVRDEKSIFADFSLKNLLNYVIPESTTPEPVTTTITTTVEPIAVEESTPVQPQAQEEAVHDQDQVSVEHLTASTVDLSTTNFEPISEAEEEDLVRKREQLIKSYAAKKYQRKRLVGKRRRPGSTTPAPLDASVVPEETPVASEAQSEQEQPAEVPSAVPFAPTALPSSSSEQSPTSFTKKKKNRHFLDKLPSRPTTALPTTALPTEAAETTPSVRPGIPRGSNPNVFKQWAGDKLSQAEFEREVLGVSTATEVSVKSSICVRGRCFSADADENSANK